MTFVEQHLSFREQPLEHRVLLVDDDDAVREMATRTLENKGFVVVAASGVTEALKLITTEPFDVLVTDLHMPNPADGFTVVTAMRHSQPNATTVIVSGYPDVQGAMDTIRLQADEIIMKPVEFNSLAEVCRNRVKGTGECDPAPLRPRDRSELVGSDQRMPGTQTHDARRQRTNGISWATDRRPGGASRQVQQFFEGWRFHSVCFGRDSWQAAISAKL
jgi:DNA-binding NtrC family response regulator